MSKKDYEKLEKSLERLREQYMFFKANEQSLSDKNIQEAVQESVIQRFEVCYDTFWKHLKICLENQGLTDLPNSPNPIFKIAHKNNLIGDVEDWVSDPNGYTRMRINTAHDYSREKAAQTLEKVGDFIEDVTESYQMMLDLE